MNLESHLRSELSKPIEHEGKVIELTQLCAEVALSVVIRVLRARQAAKGGQG